MNNHYDGEHFSKKEILIIFNQPLYKDDYNNYCNFNNTAVPVIVVVPLAASGHELYGNRSDGL